MSDILIEKAYRDGFAAGSKEVMNKLDSYLHPIVVPEIIKEFKDFLGSQPRVRILQNLMENRDAMLVRIVVDYPEIKYMPTSAERGEKP